MKSPTPIREDQLRIALRAYLSAEALSSTLIEEMSLERGAARIDMALVGPRLLGFEIKSDLDGPERFMNQIHAYNRVFDEVYLVCSRRACQGFEDVIPSWWGMIAAEWRDGNCALAPHRPAGLNSKRDAMSLALLLRRDEVLAAYSRHLGCDASARSNKTQLQGKLAATLSVAELGTIVVEALRGRLTGGPVA